MKKKSDIDIAVKGLENKFFFRAIGQLLIELNHEINLIDFEQESEFNKYICNHANLFRVA